MPTHKHRKVEGGRALLFERLSGTGPHDGEEDGARPLRVHDEGALMESVKRELGRLFNTRAAGPLASREGREMSVLDYGLPDFSSLLALSGDDRARLAKAVKASVEAFEPRLRDVSVTVIGSRSYDRALVMRLDAKLVKGEFSEPVHFNLLGPEGGRGGIRLSEEGDEQ